MIKGKLVNSVLYEGLKQEMREETKTPLFNNLHVNARSVVDRIMSLQTDPIFYKSAIRATKYNSEISNILALFDSLNKIASSATKDYVDVTTKYINIYNKMKVMLGDYKKRIDILLDRNCLAVDTSCKNEMLESKCGHFGTYITLPYFVNTAKIYNGGVIMSIISDADIQFSNLDSINTLPFTNKPSFKVVSASNSISSRIRIVFAEDKYNAFYINIPSDKITSMQVSVKAVNGEIVKTFDNGEAFLTFDKTTVSTIDVVINSNNYNPGKPYSMVISDLLIVKNIEFMNSGSFKSKPIIMNQLKKIDELTVANTHVDQEGTDIQQFVAISSDEGIMLYNKVENDRYLDISSYTLNKSKDLLLTNDINQFERFKIIFNGNEYYFYKFPYTSSSELWEMDYTKAQIVTGINKTIMAIGTDVAQKYENWVTDGTYQRTKLINFSDNVTMNLGKRKLIMNEREVTGVVQIPFGIVDIKVHNKDINLTKNITKWDEVYGDESLREDNFAFLFTGVPAFSGTGEQAYPLMEEKVFNITGPSVLYMNEPFIAGGFEVEDNNGIDYRLHLSKNVTVENTFTVEPNKGIVKVYPNEKTKSVTVRYYKCDINRPSIGILCRDLLTFTPIAGLIEPETTKSVFSIDGDFNQRVLYIPNPFIDGQGEEVDLHLHSQVLYSNENEQLFLSVMMEMRSINKYISPAIKSVSISVR